MKVTDYIHLDAAGLTKTVDSLQKLLADYQVFYTNLRALHWNIKGKNFFVLHEKFEEYYDDVAAKVDEIAERILTLGGVPENKFSEYLKKSTIKEVGVINCGCEATKNIIETFGILVKEQRQILKLAGDNSDEVTVDIMVGYIADQEKKLWMLTSVVANCEGGSCEKK